ncbi:hypothetical protein FRC08_009615 [Ceratobasidium sp. 394]|nr:hypothetical protein FRC08_009615 [Ceratobasidium sp. 394]
MSFDGELEAFKAFAASRGFVLQPMQPVTSAQPTQQTAPTPPAASTPLVASVPPAMSTPPSLSSAALARRVASKQQATLA